MYQTVALVTPALNPKTTDVVEIDVMSPVTVDWLSDSIHTGADAHGWANVIVTDVSAVPATAIEPASSFEGLFMLDVPPDTVGVGPPVMI